ncbi:hypothetical protein D0869_06031 [Hortaea werneckii]|uniref:CENP-V/GFA domain-containing protein n=1 Tax=Hortaea werneckii TaxID=91943 RepID=A0A3M6Z8Z4_HORWE|nr:hypothetical protein D0869_06031 [Hortaea werneckii]RMY11694.1 hypothetical protein D0867_08003 [Hortaea werneckii]
MTNQPTGDPKQHDASKFSESLSGSCLCGSITVAGSYVASNLLIEAEKVTIDDKNGTLKCYEDKATLSGNPVYRFFCSTDGNPVKSETAAYPGKVVLKMGIMPRIPRPEMEGFGLHRHEWQGTHEGVQIYKVKWAGPEKELMS